MLDLSNTEKNPLHLRSAVPRTSVDVNSLYAALDAAREAKSMSWRQLAKEIGVSPSTMSRLANDLKPDVNAFAAMVTWLGVPAERFMIDEGSAQHPRPEEPPLMAELAPLLRARSDLRPEDVEHLEEIINSAVRRFATERPVQ
ncbi:helix-turn-helix protein [Saccharothrix saharensis]|uniref:Helix-turn-helix protein n=1 Tax=Saccharothrix saharensis TaxID=571190 RepID=A0A543JNS7_9PSEU|nr:helix-turn-helix domain-containing protein [Saccharothrix saharensis]TQM84507.1 helix-turn-helix protein [Saccharothrix saharensis]